MGGDDIFSSMFGGGKHLSLLQMRLWLRVRTPAQPDVITWASGATELQDADICSALLTLCMV